MITSRGLGQAIAVAYRHTGASLTHAKPFMLVMSWKQI